MHDIPIASSACPTYAWHDFDTRTGKEILTATQAIVFVSLLAALALFIWGRWRYDVVAMLTLFVLVLAGIVSPDRAFSGFGHPAVITVAAVLVISRGLSNAGVVDMIAGWLSHVGKHPVLQVGTLTIVVALCSGFMNNVGALALLMPVAIRMARESGQPASRLLMPLAFGSLLGGLITMIGTPPNIIVATFRARNGHEAFGMFDFAPVGATLAIVCVLFISLIGWRLLPRRKGEAQPDELFEIEDYLAELHVPESSKLSGKMLSEIGDISDAEVTIIGLLRDQQRIPAYSPYEIIREGDILAVQADSEELESFVKETGADISSDEEDKEPRVKSEDINMAEAVVLGDSVMEGQSARSLLLRLRHGINLLAVARQGERLHGRLANIRFRAGDVILLQGAREALHEAITGLGCLPLAQRNLQIGQPRRLILSLLFFGVAIAAAVMNVLPIQISLTGAALAMIITGIISPRKLYDSIDWSVIILLGAMIPVGLALEETGGAALIADGMLNVGAEWPPILTLLVLMVVTMTLSDVINNAAAAVLMCPIAFGLADGLNISADPLLMGVAVGASCAFLTPIGHQSNTLVMGPGGYKFSDYWRLGLPVQLIILLISVPLIPSIWPF